MFFPSVAVKAIFCPSGEMTAASSCASLKERFGGGLNDSRAARVSVEGRLKYITPKASDTRASAPATIHARRPRHRDGLALSSMIAFAVVRLFPDELDGADNASSAKPRSCAEWKRCSGLFS